MNENNYDLEKLGKLAMTDPTNPDHYRADPSGVECIEITRHRNFNVGNAFKYLWRAGLKTEQGKTATEKQIEDLEKAAWYLQDEIRRLRAIGEKAQEITIELDIEDAVEAFMEKLKMSTTTANRISEALRGVMDGTHEMRAEHGPELSIPTAEGKTIRKIQYQAFQASKAKGFWDDADRHNDDGQAFLAFIAQKLALIHSEVTEALDEVRDNRPDWIIRYAEDGKPEGIASELADVVIRTLDLAEWLGIDTQAVIEEKMAYNKTRPAKHGKNF